MFASIVTVTAVCIALAISGWDPPDTSLYVEDSTQFMLSYDQSSFDWPYEISTDEIAEWFLFFDDQKLIDYQYSESRQCDCYGTAVHKVDRVILGRGNLPRLHITSYQPIPSLEFDLQRLRYIIKGIESGTFLTRWKNVPVLSKPDSLSRVNPGERNPRRTIPLDGRLLLFSILLQIALWGYKHHFIDKKIREQIKSCELTEERLEVFGREIRKTLAQSEAAALMTIDRLDLKPKNTIQPGDMFSWTSQDGYSPNWYKISTTKTTLNKDTSPLYEIPDWQHISKEY